MQSSTAAWRFSLLSLCALSLIVQVISVYRSAFATATTGITVRSSAPDFVYHVGVRPGSAAAHAGVHDGDSIDLRSVDNWIRYRFSTGVWSAGERANIRAGAGNAMRPIVIAVERRRPHNWTWWMGVVGGQWALAFAALISWRRADHPEARILALALVLFTDFVGLSAYNFQTPWPVVDAIAHGIGQVFAALNAALLATYSVRLALPVRALRNVAVWCTYVTCGLSACIGIAAIAGPWFGVLDPSGALYNNLIVQFLDSVLPIGLALLSVVLALVEARGSERSRGVWAAGPLSLLYFLIIIDTVFYQVFQIQSDAPGIAENVCLFLAPAGLTYSLLSRKLLDIGFVLNRAAAFAATTLTLAGLFAALQWLANTTLTNLAHAHDVIVQLSIAVVVFYVVRFTRGHTDRLVTHVFFAGRERRIREIRAIAEGVDALTDLDALVPLVASALRERAAVEARVIFPDSQGAGVDAEHDSWRLFPMVMRGRGRGVLACKPCAGGDEIAPDEAAAFSALASAIAMAREELLADALQSELVALRTLSVPT